MLLKCHRSFLNFEISLFSSFKKIGGYESGGGWEKPVFYDIDIFEEYKLVVCRGSSV